MTWEIPEDSAKEILQHTLFRGSDLLGISHVARGSVLALDSAASGGFDHNSKRFTVRSNTSDVRDSVVLVDNSSDQTVHSIIDDHLLYVEEETQEETRKANRLLALLGGCPKDRHGSSMLADVAQSLLDKGTYSPVIIQEIYDRSLDIRNQVCKKKDLDIEDRRSLVWSGRML